MALPELFRIHLGGSTFVFSSILLNLSLLFWDTFSTRLRGIEEESRNIVSQACAVYLDNESSDETIAKSLQRQANDYYAILWKWITYLATSSTITGVAVLYFGIEGGWNALFFLPIVGYLTISKLLYRFFFLRKSDRLLSQKQPIGPEPPLPPDPTPLPYEAGNPSKSLVYQQIRDLQQGLGTPPSEPPNS